MNSMQHRLESDLPWQSGELRLRALAIAATLALAASPALCQCQTWSAPAGTNGAVSRMCVFDDGAGPALYACGRFTLAGGASADNVARFDGTSWTALGSGLASGVTTAGSALAVFDDGSGAALYVGGDFSNAGGVSANEIARWDGSNWSALGSGMDDQVYALATFDDGSGPALYAGGWFTNGGGVGATYIARWNGASWSTVGGGVNSGFPFSTAVYALCVFDDGSGPALYAGGFFSTAGGVGANHIARWDGTNWSALTSGIGGAGQTVNSLAVFDDGSGPALFVGGSFTSAGGVSAISIAKWDGASWSALGSGMGGVSVPSVNDMLVFDDGSGPALYAAGSFATAGGTSASRIARWDGASWTALGSGLASTGVLNGAALAAYDDGAGEGPSLFAGGRFTDAGGTPAANVGQWHGCRITSFCFGDGIDPNVTTPCPCANNGAPGRGCAWHNGPNGALLATSGRIAPSDTLVLEASGMPNSATALFFKGSALELGGSAVFGDGVRCAGGSIIRLGTKICVAGAAHYPEAGNASISERSATPVGSGISAWYQTHYRNAASFCTSATFNATNGVKVVW